MPRSLWLGLAALAALIAALALLPGAQAQCVGGPANDCFAAATAVPVVPFTALQSTAGATTESGEPSPCSGIASTVWFTYTPIVTGSITLSTVSPATSYDTVLAAYTGSSVNALTTLGCNDDFPTCCQSQVTVPCTAGVPLSVQVGGYYGSQGDVQLSMSDCTPAPPSAPCVSGGPPNDCFDAPFLASGDSYSGSGDNTNAAMETGEPNPCCTSDHSIWWRWTPASTGQASINLCGSSMDTVLAVYTGSQVNALNSLGFNDDSGSQGPCPFTFQSYLEFPCTAGVDYQVQVLGYSGAQGPVQVTMECVPPCVTPANDCFDGAIPVGANSYANTQTTAGAQMEPGEPTPCCAIGKSVWYDWTPTTTGFATVSTCGSTYNTVVAAYTGPAYGALSTVGSNDNSCGVQSFLSFACTAGTTYHVQVSSASNGAAGTLQLDMTCALPCSIPTNDCFDDATVLPGNSATLSQGTSGATMQAGEPSPCCAVGKSVWFAWTPSITGSAVVSTCGSNYNTVVAAYTGNLLPSLTLAALNDNSCGVQSSVAFPCVAGTTYRIQVSSASNGVPGALQLNASCQPPLCGYAIETSGVYDFVDLTATGTATGLRMLDDTAITVPLPFTFKFCGVNYTDLRASSNGYVCLGTASPISCTDWSPTSVPSTGNPRPAVYGYYTDLYASFCSSTTPGSCTSWEVLGTAPNRVFVYMEKAVGFCCSASPNPVTFEIKLFETTNCVEVHYQAVSDPNLNHRTVAGYENAPGTVGYAYADTVPGFTRTTEAWRACPPGPFDAINDAFTLNEDQVSQGLPVMGNDNNEYGGTPSLASVTVPSKGTATIVGLNVIYTPAPHKTGTDSFQYTWVDNLGHSDTATVTVTINAVNDAPSFAASTQTVVVQPGTPIVLPGWATGVAPAPVAATDEVGQSITFGVSYNSNPALFSSAPTLQRTTSAQATEASPGAGAFAVLRLNPSGIINNSTVCFRALDSGGTAISTNTWGATATGINLGLPLCVNVVVNAPPVAHFQPSDAGPQPGQPVTFNPCPGPVPECSYDPNDSLALYLWEFGDGQSSALQNPSHSYNSAGTYVVRLTVWDSFGAMATYTRTLVVGHGGGASFNEASQEPARLPPTADAGANRTVIEGSPVRLAGTQRGGDAGTRFEWTQVGGPKVQLTGSTTADASFVAPTLKGAEAEMLVFSLRVTDGSAVSAPAYVFIRVASANHVPVAHAGEPVDAAIGSVVSLDASRSADLDGDALVYAWEQVLAPGDVYVRLSDPGAAQPTFTAPAGTGMLRFRLTVTDGKATSQDHVTVLLQPAVTSARDLEPQPEPSESPEAQAIEPTAAAMTGPLLLGILGIVAVAVPLVLLMVRKLR